MVELGLIVPSVSIPAETAGFNSPPETAPMAKPLAISQADAQDNVEILSRLLRAGARCGRCGQHHITRTNVKKSTALLTEANV